MEIDREPNVQGTGEKANLTFTNSAGQNQLFASLLLSEPNASQNIYQSSFANQDKQNDLSKKTFNETNNNEAENNFKRNYSEQRVLKSFYVYSALKVIFYSKKLISAKFFNKILLIYFNNLLGISYTSFELC